MRRSFLILAGVGGVLALATAWIAPHLAAGPTPEVYVVAHASHPAVEAEAGICPWRDPAGDQRLFFPTATQVRDDLFILSHQRIEIAKRLGRLPGGADNSIRAHTMLRERTLLGTIVTRAVRGESGVIELVLAVGVDGKVIGVRLQRLREPDEAARALEAPAWLNAFIGKTAQSDWRPGRGVPEVNAAARSSAEAILEGVRTELILLEAGRRTQGVRS